MSIMLQVKDLGISFGGLKAVEGISFAVNPGEIIGLIGPNGAGKTTVFNLLTGVYKPTSGSIYLGAKNIAGMATHVIAQMGVTRTFQNIRLFKKLSVMDNIKIACHNQMRYTAIEGALRIGRYWSEERMADARAMELLGVFGMEDMAEARADSLPYGAQRKLEILRALAARPKLLLLDEPAAGMNPIETQELMSIIKAIRTKFSVAILLIEHDMSLVMGICERILVLDYGHMIASGSPEEIRQNQKVIGAYLGGE